MGKRCGAMLRERRWPCVEGERGLLGGARAWRSTCVEERGEARFGLRVGAGER